MKVKGSRCKKCAICTGNPTHTPCIQRLRPLSHPGRYGFERHFFNSWGAQDCCCCICCGSKMWRTEHKLKKATSKSISVWQHSARCSSRRTLRSWNARCKLPAANHCIIFPQTKCSARKLHRKLPLRRFAPLVIDVLNRIVYKAPQNAWWWTIEMPRCFDCIHELAH